MKQPNGYGSITKLKGHRRKPFMVRITTGRVLDAAGNMKLNRTVLGYYPTRKEAVQALAEYNTKPYDLKTKEVTLNEIYKLWSEEKYPNLAERSIANYKAAYNYMENTKNVPIRDLRKMHLQESISLCTAGYATKKNIRTLYHQLFDYAIQNDIADKNYAEFIDIGENVPVIKRTVFSSEEIALLWKNIDRMDYLDSILILIYSGMRVGELLEMQRCNVDLKAKTMKIVRAKNKSSLRTVPIHDKILPIVKKYYDLNKTPLMPNTDGNYFTYTNYQQKKWKQIMTQLELSHLPHDTRHTFASLADTAGLKKICIKRIMGHESKDITDKVYTHKDISELLEQINMIKE